MLQGNQGSLLPNIYHILILCSKRLVGDVDFEKVKDKCELITPVPGGVGRLFYFSFI